MLYANLVNIELLKTILDNCYQTSVFLTAITLILDHLRNAHVRYKKVNNEI